MSFYSVINFIAHNSHTVWLPSLNHECQWMTKIFIIAQPREVRSVRGVQRRECLSERDQPNVFAVNHSYYQQIPSFSCTNVRIACYTYGKSSTVSHCLQSVHHKKIKLSYKIMLTVRSFFRNCRHAKRNIWPHSTVFNEQQKCCKSPQEYRIQKITQTLEPFEAAEENYGDERY